MYYNNDIIRMLKQYYEKGHNQHLYITIAEIMDKDICSVDVYLYNEVREEMGDYLFQISNIRAITEGYDYKTPFESYFRGTEFRLTTNYTYLSYAPLYCDREFVLRKKTGITKDDIYNCAEYFIKKVLNYHWIWNIEILNKKDVEKLEKENLKRKLDLLTKKEKGGINEFIKFCGNIYNFRKCNYRFNKTK